MIKKYIPLLMISMLFSACANVTIRDKGTEKIDTPPTYSSSKAFFFWGIAGTGHVSIKEVCGGKKAIQLQSQKTFFDGFLGLITLGIYAPRTAKVWCEGAEESQS